MGNIRFITIIVLVISLESCSNCSDADLKIMVNKSITRFEKDNSCEVSLNTEKLKEGEIQLKVSFDSEILVGLLVGEVCNDIPKPCQNFSKIKILSESDKIITELTHQELLIVRQRKDKYDQFLKSFVKKKYKDFIASFATDELRKMNIKEAIEFFEKIDFSEFKYNGFQIKPFNGHRYINFFSSSKDHSLSIAFSIDEEGDYVYGFQVN